MLSNRKSSQQAESGRGMPYLIKTALCASRQCSHQGERLLPPALAENVITSLFFFIPTVAASNFPALILEYFFSPDILIHIFLVRLTLFPRPANFF